LLVTCVCPCGCCCDGLIRKSDTASVSVLNNCYTWTFMIPSSAPCGIRVLVVVVAHFLTVQLLRISNTGRALTNDGRVLVRALTITQRAAFKLSRANRGTAKLLGKPARNCNI